MSAHDKSEPLKAWGDDVALRGEDAPKNDGSIKHLIQYLLTVYERFGNTAVTADLQWGATALWKRDEQKERIAELEQRLAALSADRPSDGPGLLATKADMDADMWRLHARSFDAFLNELYAIMVDPCAEGSIKRDDLMQALKDAALRDREKWGNIAPSSVADTNEWPHGKATLAAATPKPTYDENPPFGGRSGGFLLYCHVYEARWAALKSREYCPQWNQVPPEIKEQWETLAANIATEVARKAPASATSPTRGRGITSADFIRCENGHDNNPNNSECWRSTCGARLIRRSEGRDA